MTEIPDGNSYTALQTFCWLVTRNAQTVATLDNPPVLIPIHGRASNLKGASDFQVYVQHHDAMTLKGPVSKFAARLAPNGSWTASVASDDLWEIIEGAATFAFYDSLPSKASVDAIACIDIAKLDDRSIALPTTRWRRYDGREDPTDYYDEMETVAEACLRGDLVATGVLRGASAAGQTEPTPERLRDAGLLRQIPKEEWTHLRFFRRGYIGRRDNERLATMLGDFYLGWPTHHRYKSGGMIDVPATERELRAFADMARSAPTWTDVRFQADQVRRLFADRLTAQAVIRRAHRDVRHLFPLTFEEAEIIFTAAEPWMATTGRDKRRAALDSEQEKQGTGPKRDRAKAAERIAELRAYVNADWPGPTK